MNHRSTLSRREFAALAAGVPFALGRQASAALTAGAVIDRIKAHVGVEWKPDTVDAVKAGDPATTVTGIVTTSMATLPVLREAVKSGANLIVTFEPAFYGSADARQPPPARGGFQTTPPPGPERRDPVYAAKNDFVDRHRLVVFRLRDHWRQRRPDPFAEGLGGALGWKPHQAGADPSTYEIPVVSLERLAAHVKSTLGVRGGMRVIGDRRTAVRRVALLPGSTPLASTLERLPGVDAVIAGEVREWESVEYARDAVHAGQKKGLILTGRVVSEEPGMRVCADWLETLVPELPTRHVAAGDPYWRP